MLLLQRKAAGSFSALSALLLIGVSLCPRGAFAAGNTYAPNAPNSLANIYGTPPACSATPDGDKLSSAAEDQSLYAMVMSKCNNGDPGASKACCQYSYCAYKYAFEANYTPIAPMGNLQYQDINGNKVDAYVNLTTFTGAPFSIVTTNYPTPGTGTGTANDPFLNGYQGQTSQAVIYDPANGTQALNYLTTDYALIVNAYQNYYNLQSNALTHFSGAPYNVSSSNCLAYSQMTNEVQNIQTKMNAFEANNPPPAIQFERQGPDLTGANGSNSPAANPGPYSQVSPLPLPCIAPPAPVSAKGGVTAPPGYRVCYGTTPTAGTDVQSVPDVLPLVLSQTEIYLQNIIAAYYKGCDITSTPLTAKGVANCKPTNSGAGPTTVCNMSPVTFTQTTPGLPSSLFPKNEVFPSGEFGTGASNYLGNSCGPWSLTTNGTSGQNCQIVGSIGTPGNAETSYYMGAFVAAVDCAWAQVKNSLISSAAGGKVPTIPLTVTLSNGQPPATPWYAAWISTGLSPAEQSLSSAANLSNIEQCPAAQVLGPSLTTGGIGAVENGTFAPPNSTSTSVISACQLYTLRTAIETLAVEITAQEVINRAARSFENFMVNSNNVGVFNSFGAFLAQRASDCKAYSSSCNNAAYQQGCYAPEFNKFFITGVNPDGSANTASPPTGGRFTSIWNSGVCQ